MKITAVNIPEFYSKCDGLDDIKMHRLQDVVLIVGKNGSGKTRLLNKIKKLLGEKPTKQVTDDILGRGSMEELLGKKCELENKINKDLHRDYDDIKDLNGIRRCIEELEYINNWNYITTSQLSNKYNFVDFVPKVVKLEDCNTYTKDEIRGYAMQIDRLSLEDYHKLVFSKIQYLQDQYVNVKHEEADVDIKLKEKIVNEYLRLKEYIKTLLNTELTRSSEGDAELFGFRLGESNLSDGQNILLQFCMAIYAQINSLNDLIVFMDEPENHLHPSIIIEIIDKILSNLVNGQLWIATHSINIVAHFEPSCIWYMEDGRISYVGRIPDKVIKGLIGNGYEIDKFSDFLSLPAQFASNEFAYECLLMPKTVEIAIGDPQMNQIRQVTEIKNKTRVLDLGAGKGRLISHIYDRSNNEESIENWIDYVAFDYDDKDKVTCCGAILQAYGTYCDKRYYNEKELLLNDHKNNKFDIIVMCNVLHEIKPMEWTSIFSSDELIMNLLKEDGILLIVEDQVLPRGEKAYTEGFLVLDKTQFRKLFKLLDHEDYTTFDARGDGRLKAHLIPRNFLGRIDKTSIKEAVLDLNNKSKEQIKSIRQGTPSYKSGKLHGFWTQQFTNSQLILDEMK